MTSYILDAAGDKVFFSSLPMTMIFTSRVEKKIFNDNVTDF